jgi:probable F420-dependent oxidoreductase
MDIWYQRDPRPVLQHLAEAERRGFDGVMLPEHIVMNPEELDEYQYKDSASYQDDGVETDLMFSERTPFLEPIAYLAAIAAVTSRVTLSTNVLLSPLRPATLLAKQLATLDQLSGGRVQIGYGVGWVKLDYAAQGLSWERRYGRMVEIAEACKAIWTTAPASFHGEHVNFDGVFSFPQPVQPGGVPQIFGIGHSERNLERIARVADGWCPLLLTPDEVKVDVEKIKARMVELGRDPSNFIVRLHANPVKKNGKASLDATLATIPALLEAGATDVSVSAMDFCDSPDEFEGFVDECVSAKRHNS